VTDFLHHHPGLDPATNDKINNPFGDCPWQLAAHQYNHPADAHTQYER
jgi:hypothetical protein